MEYPGALDDSGTVHVSCASSELWGKCNGRITSSCSRNPDVHGVFERDEEPIEEASALLLLDCFQFSA